jgi:hypothetical protein
MATIAIDTNGIVKKLEARGFSRAQAEGITEALKELDTTLVSKSDLDDAVKTLQVAMRDQAIGIIKWVTGILLAQGAFIVALIQYIKQRQPPPPTDTASTTQ